MPCPLTHTSAAQDWSKTCTTTPRPRVDSVIASSRPALLSLLLWAEVPSWPCTRRSKRRAKPPHGVRSLHGASALSLRQRPPHTAGVRMVYRGSPGADRGGAQRLALVA